MEQIHADILPPPHSYAQAEIIEHTAKGGSTALYAGKRWGKTLIAGEVLIIEGFKNPGMYWWVGLSWKSASMKRAWRTLKSWHRKIWNAKGLTNKEIKDRYVKENEKELYFPTGINEFGEFETKFFIWFRTVDNPESIQGEGPKGIVADEIAFMKSEVYFNKIEPCTLDNAAWVILMTSSNDECWFEDFWQGCKRDELAGLGTWIAREYTTFTNPLIMDDPKRRAKLEEILRKTPQDIVDREYWCKRRSTVSKAFDPRAVEDCVDVGVFQRPYIAGTIYVAYVDASGGGQNAYAISIGHKEIVKQYVKNKLDDEGKFEDVEIFVQDLKKARNFAHTKATTAEYADDCRRYGIGKVLGDKFSGDWVLNEFVSNGIMYEASPMTKSELFQNASVPVNQRRASILDDGRDNNSTQEQLKGIETKVTADHYKYVKGENMNDDSANVFCGNVYQLTSTVLPNAKPKIDRVQTSEVPIERMTERYTAKRAIAALFN